MVSLNVAYVVFIFLGLLGIKTGIDFWYKDTKHEVINHGLSALIDFVIYVASVWFFLIASPFGLSVVAGIGVVWIMLALRWILYDLQYNTLHDLPWDHYGDTSKFDKFMKATGKWHIVIKIVMLLIGIIPFV